MAVLTRFSIEHYRGFYERREITPAVPDDSKGSGLTVLVGPNNSGKSTVVTAIKLLALGPGQIPVEHRHAGEAVRISSRNDAGEEKTLTNPDFGALTVIEGIQAAFPGQTDLRFVPSRRTWLPYTPRHQIGTADYWNYGLNLETDDEFLVSRIARLTAEEKTDFNALLKELLPQLSSWRIELSRSQLFVLYETLGGAQHASDLFGEGMSSLFRVALALNDSTPNQVVVIDEPELSLHPQAQKQLASVLSRFAANRQIVITTHSPYFVNWSDLAHGAKVYRLTQERQGISVGSLQEATITDLERLVGDWQKPNLLDAVAREVFFADEVVFFEGQEDVGLIRKFTDDRDLPPVASFGYGAGGFGNIRHFLRMATDLGIPAAAIYDGDQPEAKVRAQKEFPGSFIELLPTPDIRDKPDGKLGIFDRNGVIKAEYEAFLIELLTRLRKALAAQKTQH